MMKEGSGRAEEPSQQPPPRLAPPPPDDAEAEGAMEAEEEVEEDSSQHGSRGEESYRLTRSSGPLRSGQRDDHRYHHRRSDHSAQPHSRSLPSLALSQEEDAPQPHQEEEPKLQPPPQRGRAHTIGQETSSSSSPREVRWSAPPVAVLSSSTSSAAKNLGRGGGATKGQRTSHMNRSRSVQVLRSGGSSLSASPSSAASLSFPTLPPSKRRSLLLASSSSSSASSSASSTVTSSRDYTTSSSYTSLPSTPTNGLVDESSSASSSSSSSSRYYRGPPSRHHHRRRRRRRRYQFEEGDEEEDEEEEDDSSYPRRNASTSYTFSGGDESDQPRKWIRLLLSIGNFISLLSYLFCLYMFLIVFVTCIAFTINFVLQLIFAVVVENSSHHRLSSENRSSVERNLISASLVTVGVYAVMVLPILLYEVYHFAKDSWTLKSQYQEFGNRILYTGLPQRVLKRWYGFEAVLRSTRTSHKRRHFFLRCFVIIPSFLAAIAICIADSGGLSVFPSWFLCISFAMVLSLAAFWLLVGYYRFLLEESEYYLWIRTKWESCKYSQLVSLSTSNGSRGGVIEEKESEIAKTVEEGRSPFSQNEALEDEGNEGEEEDEDYSHLGDEEREELLKRQRLRRELQRGLITIRQQQIQQQQETPSSAPFFDKKEERDTREQVQARTGDPPEGFVANSMSYVVAYRALLLVLALLTPLAYHMAIWEYHVKGKKPLSPLRSCTSSPSSALSSLSSSFTSSLHHSLNCSDPTVQQNTSTKEDEEKKEQNKNAKYYLLIVWRIAMRIFWLTLWLVLPMSLFAVIVFFVLVSVEAGLHAFFFFMLTYPVLAVVIRKLWSPRRGMLWPLFVFLFLLIVFVFGFAFLMGVVTQHATSTQSSPVFLHPPSSPITSSTHTIIEYQLCNANWFGLDIIDFGLFSWLAYYEPSSSEFQQNFERWFGDEDWEVAYSSPPTNPVTFFDAYSASRNLSVVSVRGTTTLVDTFEDMSLWAEAIQLQTISLVFPFVYVWPDSTIALLVQVMAYVEKIILPPQGEDFTYFEEVNHYVRSIKHQRNVLLSGHSLGGSVAKVVGATQRRPAITYNAPGTVYSRRKFGIELVDINKFSVTVRPLSDLISRIDRAGGVTQDVRCRNTNFAFLDCHLLDNVMCPLIAGGCGRRAVSPIDCQ